MLLRKKMNEAQFTSIFLRSNRKLKNSNSCNVKSQLCIQFTQSTTKHLILTFISWIIKILIDLAFSKTW